MLTLTPPLPLPFPFPTHHAQVVKLGDLGWSIVKRATSKRTTLCGTIEYLPPEVCRGAEAQLREGRALVGGMSLGAEYDESFDAYTLGALLYEMLVGHSPFAGPAFARDPGAMAEAPLVGRILNGTFTIPVHLRLSRLEFVNGETRQSLGLTGFETYDIMALDDTLTPRATLTVKATANDGTVQSFSARCRIDTPEEMQYYKHGGILPYVLRSLIGK